MDRALWQRNLAQAEQAAADGARHIARQRELIDELERDGHDTRNARVLLAQFETLQVLHLEHRDRLLNDLESRQGKP